LTQFSVGFRNGFGFDLELTPKEVGFAHDPETGEEVALLSIQAMTLRLPLVVFEVLFIEVID
jgi:hypothetical protein